MLSGGNASQAAFAVGKPLSQFYFSDFDVLGSVNTLLNATIRNAPEAPSAPNPIARPFFSFRAFKLS